jgi:hypothetical protein
MVCRIRGGLPPERFDQGGHVTAVFGREFVDAGDQEFPLAVTRLLLTRRGVVVVVQSRGLGGGGTDH